MKNNKLILSLFFACITLISSTADARKIYNLVYIGKYMVYLMDDDVTLNCRSGPGLDHPIIEQLEIGQVINTIKYIDKKKPWLQTDLNCYVRASSAYLVWDGEGEDPSTMCDWREGPC